MKAIGFVRRHTNPFDGLKPAARPALVGGLAVRRHTNPFDGLKLVDGLRGGRDEGSKAHKSVRRIETPDLPYQAIDQGVRRHTNPFDGLKHHIALPPDPELLGSKAHKSVRRIETSVFLRHRKAQAVRRHTNPFDGLKPG